MGRTQYPLTKFSVEEFEREKSCAAANFTSHYHITGTKDCVNCGRGVTGRRQPRSYDIPQVKSVSRVQGGLMVIEPGHILGGVMGGIMGGVMTGFMQVAYTDGVFCRIKTSALKTWKNLRAQPRRLELWLQRHRLPPLDHEKFDWYLRHAFGREIYGLAIVAFEQHQQFLLKGIYGGCKQPEWYLRDPKTGQQFWFVPRPERWAVLDKMRGKSTRDTFIEDMTESLRRSFGFNSAAWGGVYGQMDTAYDKLRDLPGPLQEPPPRIMVRHRRVRITCSTNYGGRLNMNKRNLFILAIALLLQMSLPALAQSEPAELSRLQKAGHLFKKFLVFPLYIIGGAAGGAYAGYRVWKLVGGSEGDFARAVNGGQ